ncbi:MAG: sugar kinase [Desulfovibrio sp.]|nr:sugar kinase [Desulfovibrio sp.]
MARSEEWLIVGTVPQADFPLYYGSYDLKDGWIVFGDDAPSVAVNRGTPAFLGAAWYVAQSLGGQPPRTLLVGDTGNGKGSRALYGMLCDRIREESFSGLAFHYLYPDVDWHNRLLLALESLNPRPVLCADAGFMYAAKMSGYAALYDLFTPDSGEMAFLADESAPHPFYTRGFLSGSDIPVPDLLKRAYAHENAARWMIVKGHTDYIVHDGDILERITAPDTPVMEAIGGTGDMVIGVATALLASGVPLADAASLAAHTVRRCGQIVSPTPATQILALLPAIPEALSLASEARFRAVTPS